MYPWLTGPLNDPNVWILVWTMEAESRYKKCGSLATG